MLQRLTTGRFRNLVDATTDLGPGHHLLAGGNGVGKTSVLEAVYVVATTRSFRTTSLDDCGRHGADGFYVAADVGREGRTRLEFGRRPGERARLVNGNETGLADYLGTLTTVVWSAADREVLRGSPANRRRLMDRGVVSVQREGLQVRSRYRKVLKQRRELIAARRTADQTTWDSLFADAAVALISARRRYVDRLGEALERVRERTALDIPAVTLDYRPSPAVGTEGEAAVIEELERVREREFERGHPLLGPHRDDLVIRWGGHELTSVVSAGEEKICGLLLLGAQGEVLEASGRKAVHLIDDADSELDRRRLAALWRAFEGVDQLLATTARPGVWSDLAVDRRWRVRDGQLESAS